MQGNNSRLDELQAAFLGAKLPHLDKVNIERRRIAEKYITGINNPEIILPYVPDYTIPVWHIFGIRCEKREKLEKFLMMLESVRINIIQFLCICRNAIKI